MSERTYLDYNATAPLHPNVRARMIDVLSQTGNPSSVHAEGRRQRAFLEQAREKVAALAGADPAQVVFTSGGTEANVTALSPAFAGAARRNARCFVSAIEHPSVLEGGRFGAEQVATIAVGHDGVVDCGRFKSQIEALAANQPEVPILVSVMAANNETGALQPIAEIAGIAHGVGGIVHCDAVQAAGRVPLDMERLGADMLTLSAHKIGGPHGVGALVLGDRVRPLGDALLVGGGQERRRRAGTENVAGIAGFGIAAEVALDGLSDMARLAKMRDQLEGELAAVAPGVHVFAGETARLANTTCFAVPGMLAETLVIAFDLAGVAVSAGAACSSGKVERSHVLDAMGASKDQAWAAVRVSLGPETATTDIECFVSAWSDIYGRFEEHRRAA